MSPNGRRAWRRAAKKLRRKMGHRWRSPNKWSENPWSELVPDLDAHRAHVTGAWFRRHGITEQGLQMLDASHLVRAYVGLWGAVDGDYVTYDASPRPFTTRSLVGMSQSTRKRAARAQFVELAITSQGMEIKPDDQGPRWFHLWCRGLGDVASRDPDYAALRAKYRIGERLRPDSSGVLPSQKSK